jgi:long-chain acyl-CoA synthetase
VFPTVPAYIQGLLKMSLPPALPRAVRLVIAAGAVLPQATAAQFRHTYQQPVHVFYGSSECGGICFDREGGAAERGTVGTPVNGVRLTLNALDEGSEAGEGLVVVESPGVGAGYIPGPDSRLEAGRFETRDVAAWRGGELVLLRRADRMINVRGRKVDPAEVERVLAALHGVEAAVVIGVPGPDPHDKIVRAVIACPSGALGYEDVAAWCRARLAEHKVPRSIVIVSVIPYTERGKIDHAALLNQHG